MKFIRVMHNRTLYSRILLLMIMSVMLVQMTACQKSGKAIKVFEYETMDDGNIKITGLTDKGKNDSKLTIPSQLDDKAVTVIDAGAFKDDNNVTEIVISDGIKTINSNAFYNCKALENITVPQSVESIGINAFSNTKWESVQYESHTEIVVNNILVGVKTSASEYTVPDAVKIIAAGVFYNNTDIQSIKLNSNIESIGDYAFSGCTQLNKLTLPDSVKAIGYCSFSNSSSLNITVPQSVKEVGKDAFMGVAHVSYSGNMSTKDWGADNIN